MSSRGMANIRGRGGRGRGTNQTSRAGSSRPLGVALTAGNVADGRSAIDTELEIRRDLYNDGSVNMVEPWENLKAKKRVAADTGFINDESEGEDDDEEDENQDDTPRTRAPFKKAKTIKSAVTKQGAIKTAGKTAGKTATGKAAPAAVKGKRSEAQKAADAKEAAADVDDIHAEGEQVDESLLEPRFVSVTKIVAGF
ncbi:hypothetical protein QFC21_002592 [Naganishia friedmannii]|uniref:Uncharacterized protein n=1 Tax=Naganishia friedmannii TaxID=89922 RepID=A0ACC2VWD4_9TREE|nr:hypothetical protein QFC21_002592 [Naganishia friedmannii]